MGDFCIIENNERFIKLSTKVLYLEGYLWDNEEAKRAFMEASRICKDNNGKVALSLSDSFCS